MFFQLGFPCPYPIEFLSPWACVQWHRAGCQSRSFHPGRNRDDVRWIARHCQMDSTDLMQVYSSWTQRTPKCTSPATHIFPLQTAKISSKFLMFGQNHSMSFQVFSIPKYVIFLSIVCPLTIVLPTIAFVFVCAKCLLVNSSVLQTLHDSLIGLPNALSLERWNQLVKTVENHW